MSPKNYRQLASFLGASCLFFASACSHSPATRSGKDSTIHLVFFGSPRCVAAPFGCTLGGQLGGLESQKNLFAEKKRDGELLAIWGGAVFACDKGAGTAARAASFAKKASGLPLSAIAPSDEDLRLPLAQLKQLKAESAKPWVLSNFNGKGSDLPWSPWIDIRLGHSHFRVFNMAQPEKARGLSSDTKLLEKLLDASPPNAVNIVVVSGHDTGWIERISGLPKAHLILDGSSLLSETDGPLFVPRDRIEGSVRPRGQGAFVLTMEAEPKFTGFFSQPVAEAERARLLYATKQQFSVDKVPGLWNVWGEVKLLANPPAPE